MTQIAELGTLTPSRGRQTRFTPERIQQIKNLVGRGKRREEIAELIGTTVGSLQVTCCRLGISLRRPNFNNGIVSLRRNDPRLKRIPSQGSDHGGDSALHLERNSQPQPIDEAEHLVPSHQVENWANEAGAASFAIKMQYRGEERRTELPLKITQLAVEAAFRGVPICGLIGDLIMGTLQAHARKEAAMRRRD